MSFVTRWQSGHWSPLQLAQRIGQHMLALATYLGHVNINATYWYLETTPELLLDIAVAAENFVQGGRQ